MSLNTWLVKNLQYVLSTVELYLVLFLLYCGLTSLFFSLSESLAVGCVQYSLLHLTQPNTYVAKAQPRCPPVLRRQKRRSVFQPIRELLHFLHCCSANQRAITLLALLFSQSVSYYTFCTVYVYKKNPIWHLFHCC